MKTYNPIRWILVALFGLFALVGIAHAQDAAAPAAASFTLPPDAQNVILELLGTLMVKYPILATIIGIIGTMRLWAKPVFSGLHAIIDLTPSKFDDGIWAVLYEFFTQNPLGRFLAYLLDWFASVKIQPPAPKPTP